LEAGFPTDFYSIIERLNQVQPAEYLRSRNFLNGAVTRLSPYISRGVISTKTVYDYISKLDLSETYLEKLLQELLWRDYFQRVHQNLEDRIFNEISSTQENVLNRQMPEGIVNANTGIEAIDRCLGELYKTGYMHNHMRMYTASLCCNIAGSHWKIPSSWMYYNLLDADIASNTCSWQWVAGAFGQKKYYANQENINKYSSSSQSKTFLDVSYEEIKNLRVPASLEHSIEPQLKTTFQKYPELKLNPLIPTFIYNFYNLDPLWHSAQQGNRVLLLEPSHFKKYPVSDKVLSFAIELAKNIPNIQIAAMEFKVLRPQICSSELVHKEHPLFKHYSGRKEERHWICPEVNVQFSSFFKYWKVCKKTLQKNPRQN